MEYVIVENEPLFSTADWELLKRMVPDHWSNFMYMNSLVVIEGKLKGEVVNKNILHCFKHKDTRRYMNVMRPNTYPPYEKEDITCWVFNPKGIGYPSSRYEHVSYEEATEIALPRA